MKIDPQRRKAQNEMLRRHREAGGRGFIMGYTGFGKTYVQIETARYYLRKPRKEPVDMVVDTRLNKQRWEEKFAEAGLKVRTYVCNTYAKLPPEERTKGLLLVDEADKMAAESAEVFRQVFLGEYRFVLAASATWTEEKIAFLGRLNIPCVGWIDWETASRKEWASAVKVYNVPVNLDAKDEEAYRVCTEDMKKGMRLAGGMENMKTLLDAREAAVWLKNKHRKGFYKKLTVGSLLGIMRKAMAGMRARTEIARHNPPKEKLTAELAEKLPGKVVVFAMKSDFADRLEKRLNARKKGLARAYHVNLRVPKRKEPRTKQYQGNTARKQELARAFADKKQGRVRENDQGLVVEYEVEKPQNKERYFRQIIEDFRDPAGTKVLCVVRKLDRNFDFPELKNAIVAAGTKNDFDFMQRLGRVVRKNGDSKATVVSLYTKGTNEERSIKDRQKNLRRSEIVDIKSEEELFRKLRLKKDKVQILSQ